MTVHRRSVALLIVCAIVPVFGTIALASDLGTVEGLGKALFHDPNLSLNRTQSCSTCHDPEFAFADPRGAASLGDDGVSLGDRSAPSAAYAAFSPPFHIDEEGNARGGQFWDGRAETLAEQAGGPPLNPAEMGMPSRQAVVGRILENEDYVAAFKAHFGDAVLSDADTGYNAMTDAIAAFEMTDELSPFNSRYDRYLDGATELTREEQLGEALFFSQQFTNCGMCHQLRPTGVRQREPFSNYEFHNVGTPENTALRMENGVPIGTIDDGLASNERASSASNRGKFKVPTLRNVAITAPYMHNGVFQDLRTVILFYNRYNTRSESRHINPETGQMFRNPEVPSTLAMEKLTHGRALKDREIDALVAFLKTLTDERYEHLISDNF
ncbi:MAG: cytochrome c peroxidase [Pseudomonadota bacterium]